MTISPNVRRQVSAQLIATPTNAPLRAKQALEGPQGAASSPAPGGGAWMFGGGHTRGIQGLGATFAGLICEDNTIHTSYESTLINLKTLKKKCIPRDHVVVSSVNPVDVKNRIAASLQIPPTTVDFALHQAVFSLCDGQSFWLGEVIIHMLEHGIVDFTAQLQVEGTYAVHCTLYALRLRHTPWKIQKQQNPT